MPPMLRRTIFALSLAFLAAGCDSAVVEPPPAQPPPAQPQEPPLNYTEPAVALIDLDEATYKGLEGRLYLESNDPPAAHTAFGEAAARAITPLDADGQPDADGKIVLLAIGMSNVTQEWCNVSSTSGNECDPWTFMGQAARDPAVDHNVLAIANGAKSSQALYQWDSPDEANYDRVRDEVLAPDGLTEAQVQVVWTEAALKDEPSRPSLPDPAADAYALEAAIGDVVRALKVRYPNLRQVFLSSRTFAGYAEPGVNSPEPYAYETGFGVKWAVEAQIEQHASGVVDPEAGDLGENLSEAPFMAWGPYLWAPGDEPRSDGLVWLREDFQEDGMHPSRLGEEKVADLLMAFFKSSEFTACWFLEGQTCP